MDNDTKTVVLELAKELYSKLRAIPSPMYDGTPKLYPRINIQWATRETCEGVM